MPVMVTVLASRTMPQELRERAGGLTLETPVLHLRRLRSCLGAPPQARSAQAPGMPVTFTVIASRTMQQALRERAGGLAPAPVLHLAVLQHRRPVWARMMASCTLQWALREQAGGLTLEAPVLHLCRLRSCLGAPPQPRFA